MIHFGTGGWRAVIGDDFTKANIQRVAKAIALDIENRGLQKKIAVGYDRRFLSSESARWFSEVLADNGVEVFYVDRPQPTPLIMFSVMKLGFDYGAMITASHNPAVYNGIKIFTAGGRDAAQDVTQRLEQLANSCTVSQPALDFNGDRKAGRIHYLDEFNDYIDSILAKLNVDAIKKARLSICLDPMYGVSQTSLRTILSTLRCDLTVINDRHDTLFGGRLPAPNSSALNRLRDYVLENHCDFGIATDGDADRIGVIDDIGGFVHPNHILMLLYYYLLKYKGWRGDAVRNNSTTHMLDRIAADFGQKCYEVPVGFKWISAKMQETGAIIGGESSGGLTVKGHINGKDGIYAAAILTEMVAVTGKSISENYREITERYGELFYEDRSYQLTPALKKALQEKILVQKQLPEFPLTVDHVSYEDGCKTYFRNGGWIIVRFSGTEPLVRMACEMPTEELAHQFCEIMRNALGVAETERS